MSARLEEARALFPALEQRVHDHPLVYLDSAATALKPGPVLDAVDRIYRFDSANIHRGVHTLSSRATETYENARARVARFIGAKTDEVVFCRGTTEGLNLVANAWAIPRLGPGDEILVTELEHHSNLVPWQLVAAATGAHVVAVPIDEGGELSAERVAARLSERTAVVAVTHISNVLGTRVDIAAIAAAAHEVGAAVVVDGAQAVAHIEVDVGALGCDFYAFSGHKLYGPDGIGVLWGRADQLAAMEPWQSGGGMIREVTIERSTYAPPPARFEAGTPPIAGAAGLAAAIDFVTELGWETIGAHERAMLAHGREILAALPGVEIHGEPADPVASISFSVEGIHPHDVATVADAAGVAIRSGHHCAQLLMARLGVVATARASVGIYNVASDFDVLAQAVDDARRLFR